MKRARGFNSVLTELAEPDTPFSPRNLYSFSDLDRKQASALEAAWPDLPPARRLALVQDLSELADANVEVNADAVFRVALEDEDGEIRAEAMDGLWESESPDLPGIFYNLLHTDPDYRARAAAAAALGRYVYEAELEKLNPRQGRRLEDALLKVSTGTDHAEVRRRALESLGFSSREEVPPLIEAAYASPDEAFQVSALLAMGRSADSHWGGPVLAGLSSLRPTLRIVAARAAGELELREAVPALIEALGDGDGDVRWNAIWALGQIGGKSARRALEKLLPRADEDDAEHIQDMLDNMDFVDGVNEFFILNLDDDGDDELADLPDDLGDDELTDLLDDVSDDEVENLLN